MVDIKVGENKISNENQEKFNEIRYIQEYIKFYYDKTNALLRTNKMLLIIAIILLLCNLLPNVIKFLIFLKIIT